MNDDTLARVLTDLERTPALCERCGNLYLHATDEELGDDTADLPSIRRLSPAEVQVLDAFSHGHDRAEVAAMLGKSVNTVKEQLRLAKGKLLARSTAEACCEALRLGEIR